ncbi:hypothetical protein [Kaistella sp.]|uniref:hypothetical protein n=1 Tax=Kaistella sp. TaxID=2782235 RepID=UPI00359F4D75
MTFQTKLNIIEITKIILLIIYIPALLIYLGVFVPEYLACVNINQDGAMGKSIWGNDVPCFGESNDLSKGLFIFFSLLIGGLTVGISIFFLLVYRFKKNQNLKNFKKK